jgi:hypothetical protein
MKTEALPYDDTPTGHTYAAAHIAMGLFGIAGLLLYGLAAESMINYLFYWSQP